MPNKQASPADGIYAAYFTGVAGISFGLFVFTNGVIAGVDAGDAIYDGEFDLTEDGQFIVGNVQFSIPIGGQTITGVSAENEPLTFKVPIKLPVEMNPEEVHRIETPAGPVNAKFRKIRGL